VRDLNHSCSWKLNWDSAKRNCLTGESKLQDSARDGTKQFGVLGLPENAAMTKKGAANRGNYSPFVGKKGERMRKRENGGGEKVVEDQIAAKTRAVRGIECVLK